MSQMFIDLIKHVQDLIDAINGMVLHDKSFNINGHSTCPRFRRPRHPLRRRRRPRRDAGGATSAGAKERRGGNALGREGWILPRSGGVTETFGEAGRPEYVYASPNGPPSGRGGPNVTVNVVVQGDGDAQKIRDVVQKALRAGYIKVPA